MAILSGCDYLPSINGIGLKTACALLRQWKTIEQVIQTLKEGKKSVPARYLESFRLADKCFKHQRVYCPLKQKLDHLKQPDADWDEESDAYVGADMHPTTAKLLGEGHLDPVTLSPMTDINPGYVPGVLKRMPLTDRNQRKRKASTLLGDALSVIHGRDVPNMNTFRTLYGCITCVTAISRPNPSNQHQRTDCCRG
ncbi:5'-3' exonuclease [Roridomyces roridus]|uniref:5'-3' exonuclease n=1 Tax=Roridomyces roridus TaxID=1738132 RepID=A0AAD7BXA7_9AGAR|nr:5'-3' exonuclease [Roridomyces roridus]